MTSAQAIRKLKGLKADILRDGKVDWDETGVLLDFIRPLTRKHGFLFQDYENLLKKCRADGRITKEESDKLALQLDFLCGFFANLRLKFWLTIAVMALVLVAAIALTGRVKSVVEIPVRSAEPPAEVAP